MWLVALLPFRALYALSDGDVYKRQNPDNAQKVAPSNESRTQVAVNSEGKTNEATKNLKEPLQKGQTLSLIHI